MYESFWGLTGRPFDQSLAPSFFFPSTTHEAARLKLRYAIEHQLGTAVLCGGIGTGKTAVATMLQHELPASCGPVVHLLFPQMGPGEFLGYLAAKLGAPDRTQDRHAGIDLALERIEGRLRAFGQHGRKPTIIVDEAHLIDDLRALECLQLLLNFQQDPASSFSLVLVGGISLLGRLQRIPQFHERIAVQSVVEALPPVETAAYVGHRMSAAGCTREIFDERALAALAEHSGGIPRRINRLADLALLMAYADQLPGVGPEEIRAAAMELPTAIAA